MMQQYREAKERHPGMLLLFRMGDFYELFHDDAEVGSRVLGLTLTSRDKDDPHGGLPPPGPRTLPPQAAARRPSRRHLRPGRGPRPGQGAGPARSHARRHARHPHRGRPARPAPVQSPRRPGARPTARRPAGVAWVDLSTGQFQAADVPRERLADELGRLAPAECLYSEAPGPTAETGRSLAAACASCCRSLSVTPRPDWTFDPDSARAALMHHFGVTTLAGFGFDDHQPCLAAAGALLLVPAAKRSRRTSAISRACGRAPATASSSSTR